MFAVDEQFQIFYPNNEYKWSPPSEQEDTSIFKVIITPFFLVKVLYVISVLSCTNGTVK